jgi:ribonuclease T2
MKIRSLKYFLIAICFLFLATSAEARSHKPHRPIAKPDAAGVFDYYVLSLSWSPSYCLNHQQDTEQCGQHKGFGFVLHGLWPQYAKGGYPQNCPTQARLTPEAIALGKTIFPSHKLIDHEWGKHGTCSGLDALNYFRAADQARASFKVPGALESPPQTQSMVAGAIAAHFWSANPNIPSKALAVVCSGSQISEVRFCVDRNLSPVVCGKGVKTSCPNGEIRVPAVR